VIEVFEKGDAVPVYRHLSRTGADGSGGADLCFRVGLAKSGRCYQPTETEDRALLEQWMANWSDLVDFEVETIISSTEAADKIAARL
jgi:Protein of unknown function (DUF3303)